MKKATLEVIIPTYNEEQNIGNLIANIFAQSQNNFKLVAVRVYSDQSTDATEALVKGLQKKYPLLNLSRNRARKGKYYTLSHACARTQADYVLTLDADIMLSNHKVIDTLVAYATHHTGQVLFSANEHALRPSTFEGKVIYSAFEAWNQIRLTLPNDSPWHYFGSAVLYRGDFARHLRLPPGLFDPHLYIYLFARESGGTTVVHHAYINKWSLATVSDYRKVMRRTLGKPDAKLIQKYPVSPAEIYHVPTRNKVVGMLRELAHRPFFGTLGILLSYYMSRYAKHHADKSVVWDIVKSTKRAVT